MRALVILFLLGCSLRAADTLNARSPIVAFAKACGWVANLSRGREIVQKLAALSPEALQKFDITAYRGERVAFVGWGPYARGGLQRGGWNDLETEDGLYLQVLNKAGKDLRPQAICWNVMICGKIVKVLPKSKILVIEVDERDWKTMETA